MCCPVLLTVHIVVSCSICLCLCCCSVDFILVSMVRTRKTAKESEAGSRHDSEINSNNNNVDEIELAQTETPIAVGHGKKVDDVEVNSPAPVKYEMINLYVLTGIFMTFSVTDGALRMIILFQANEVGFSAFEIALMFVLFETFGMVTNLFGGVLASKIGLRDVVIIGLLAQLGCIAMLIPFRDISDWNEMLGSGASVIIYIMFAQGLSGIGKDMVKLSGKSVAKLVVPSGDNEKLLKYVARITGHKNEMKGVGFFVGSALSQLIGFFTSLLVLAGLVVLMAPIALIKVHPKLGKSNKKINWAKVFKKGKNFNILCSARFFLFGSRDIWFETVLPIFIKNVVTWSPIVAGSILGGWTIFYGVVQGNTDSLFLVPFNIQRPHGKTLRITMGGLVTVSVVHAIALNIIYEAYGLMPMTYTLLVGLAFYGFIFAVNSSIHSYLVVLYSSSDKVAQSVGFYYMSNAAGRLVGNLIGGLLYSYWQTGGDEEEARTHGFIATLWGSAIFVALSLVATFFLNDSEEECDDKDS